MNQTDSNGHVTLNRNPCKKKRGATLRRTYDMNVIPDPKQIIDEPYYEPIPALILSRARRTPEAVAVCQGDRVWTYRELSERASEIARTLGEQGLKKGDIIALFGSRNFGSIAGMLGVLLNGSVMMPVARNLPEQRVAQMLREVHVKYLLVVESTSQKYARLAQTLPVISITPDCGTSAEPQTSFRNRRSPILNCPDDPAYIFFTSGTTGTPKAIAGTHKGISHFLEWQRKTFEICPQDRCAQLIDFSFDAVLRDVFLPLTAGATLCLPSDENDIIPGRVCDWLERERISLLNTVPSLLQTWLLHASDGLSLQSLRYLFLSGEPLNATLVKQWRKAFPHSACEIVNLYGPTETTMVKTFYRIPRKDGKSGIQPIGWPLPETQILLFEDKKQICQIGQTGEILIRTPFRSLGYLNAPQEQQAHFIKNPFRDDADDLLYRTGDLGRYRADGALEILGRLDHQVKIRGVRIELEEIENRLEQHPTIWKAAVAISRNTFEEKQLIAYVLPKKGVEPESRNIRDFLQKLLPPVMIPARFVSVEAFPLTPHGKIDRRVLSSLEQNNGDAGASSSYQEAENALERWLVSVWQTVLRSERIGIDDNFFELGGDSIKAAQVIDAIQERLQEVVHVVSLFDAQTVAELAEYLRKHYAVAITALFEAESRQASELSAKPITRADVIRFRQAIPTFTKSTKNILRKTAKNPPVVFILSPPRSGSTLLRVLLGGHPQLFAPPELKLLSFETLAERKTAFSGRESFALEGLLRAIMQIKQCQAEQARQIMQAYEEEGLSTQELYYLLQQWIGEKILVDKSTNYALDIEILQRAERDFEQPLYIHLLRHPCGMIHSFESVKLDQVFFRHKHSFTRRELAELIWLISHQNILDFFKTVPKNRQCQIEFEELVHSPRKVMEHLCQFLNISFEAQMLQPYQDPREKMTDGLHAVSRMIGDPKFHEHQHIDSHVADAWKQVYREEMLGEPARNVARHLGYLREKNMDALYENLATADTQTLLGQLDKLSDEDVSALLDDMLPKSRV